MVTLVLLLAIVSGLEGMCFLPLPMRYAYDGTLKRDSTETSNFLVLVVHVSIIASDFVTFFPK